MKTIAPQRIVAGVLALSGAAFAVVAWTVPVLWIGYVVWFGWIAVACGNRRWQEKWFWIVSAVWNGLIVVLEYNSGPSGVMTAWQLFGRIHLVSATALSSVLAILVPWDVWPENRRT